MSDLINIFILHFMAFACAMIGFVYSDVLTEPDMVLQTFYKFLERKIGKYPILFKPLIGCFRCVSGQLALWTFFVQNNYYFENPLKAAFLHIYYICLTIYISWIISKEYRN